MIACLTDGRETGHTAAAAGRTTTTWTAPPATVPILPAIAAAVGGQVEVLLDGGISG